MKHPKIGKTIVSMVLILTLTTVIAAIPASAQQIPAGAEIPTFIFLNAAPNPCGVTQPLYINVFFSKPPLTAAFMGTGIMYENITVHITKPDGTTEEHLLPKTDPTGGTWMEITPDQVGTYTLQATYPGQHIETTVFDIFSGLLIYNFTYLPSESDIIQVTVTEEPAKWNYATPAEPDEYWTRPIYSTNWNWAELGGSWFGLRAAIFSTTGGYDAMGDFQPYSKAPNTSHIVWSKPTHFGGQPGEPIPGDQMSSYMTTTITRPYFEPVIVNGIIYRTLFAGPDATPLGWEAIDLRTGEVLWERSAGESGNEVIRMGQIVRYHSMQEFGSWALIYSCEATSFFQPPPDHYNIYDAYTGMYLATIEGIQNGAFLMDFEGEIKGSLLRYYTEGGNLTMWNSTKLLFNFGIDFRLSGTYNWTDGVEWSVPIPTELNGIPINLRIAATTPEVILLRSAPTPGMFVSLSLGYQITAGVDAKTGQLLWGPINQSLPMYQDITLVGAGEGVYVLHNKDTNEAYGYSLYDGSLLWGPTKLKGNAWSVIQRASDIAYGKIYIYDYGGYVNAINLQTGEVEWTFHRGTAGYDTPYGIYPLWYNDAIADGKIFVQEGHMYDPPLCPTKLLCLNATTGELIWSILSFSGRVPPAVADGHLVNWNCFDAKIYTFGKGPTETSVSIQNDVIPFGNEVLIKGSVMDISPGAKQEGVVERFPKGLPAVADESMEEWMEYIYMQQNRPTDVKGVQVHLTAIDPNGNFQDIGYATTDRNGNFAIMWSPPVPGEYNVYATFEGSESYWRSEASTYFAVSPSNQLSQRRPHNLNSPSNRLNQNSLSNQSSQNSLLKQLKQH